MLGLVLLGFSVVVLPPVIAAARAVAYVNELSSQSEELVLKGTRLSSEGDLLGEQLTAMERNARQYQVLGDESLLHLYKEKQTRFLNSLDVIEELSGPDDIKQQIGRIRSDSEVIAFALRQHAADSRDLEEALGLFDNLTILSTRVARDSRGFINQRLKDLREAARNARHSLAWQAAALCVGTVILVSVFASLIVRPVRQTALGIRQLGEGEFNKHIEVSGPPEIAALGSELNWLRRRLDSLEQAKTKFLRQVSHELKTPLASISEGTELLIDGTAGELNATQREVATILKHNAVQLQSLIENLLNFNAREALKEGLHRSYFQLSEVIQEVSEDHQLSVVGKGLRWNLTGRDFRMFADRNRLRTALDNLVSNAVRHSPDGSEIQINVSNSGADILIEVSDEGPGIAPEDQTLIFEPFFQGRNGHQGRILGSGLGLSVARECVEAHGGTVELDRTRQLGACFRIMIPRYEPAQR